MSHNPSTKNPTNTPQAKNLSGLQSRLIAANLLYDIIHHQRSLTDALQQLEPPPLPNKTFSSKALSGKALSGKDRALVMAMVSTCLRRLGEIDATLFSFIKDPHQLKNHYALMILRICATQLLFMRVPDYAAINLAVQCAKKQNQQQNTKKFAPLINAVARKIATHGESIRKKLPLAINTPHWLWQQWVKNYGIAVAEKIALSHLADPPLDLTFSGNPPTTLPDNIPATTHAIRLQPQTLRLSKTIPIALLEEKNNPQNKKDKWWVQDIAASLAVPLLGDIRGQQVLELCAAPGGKSAQCLTAGARLTTIEKNPTRARLWQSNMRRLGLTAKLKIMDAINYRPAQPFPFILLDAPCSGTGTCRRHPDLVWRRQPAHSKRLVKQQAALLDAAYTLLAPQGILVYAVCSLEPEEGLNIINLFLEKYKTMQRQPIQPHETGGMTEIITQQGDVRSLPFHSPPLFSQKTTTPKKINSGGMDGFYIARIKKI